MNAFRQLADAWYTPERIAAERDAKEVQAHMILAARLLPPGASEIAELGCGTGTFGRLMRLVGGKSVTGYEWQPDAAAAARRHYEEVVVLDVEQETPNLAPGSLDAIVAVDVLEYLADPFATLARWATYLKADGVIVGSIRNASNQQSVQKLLYKSSVAGIDGQSVTMAQHGYTMQDLGGQLFANKLWFDGPAYGTRQPLEPSIEPLVEFMVSQGANRDRFTTEMATETYVFRLRSGQPSGQLEVQHIHTGSTPWADALPEIVPRQTLVISLSD
ncbi:MAG: class I SAM-dependent methyltransferase [Candidatus Sericytochromatia bacterium]|nr:class I SAM-dependent methyltransferase [Candidatus Sericytochromatia bacterium]